jgi:tRNA threonylcarbamoyl adenosine modification protein YeaZ
LYIMELAIDTSTEYAGVALSENGEVQVQHMWHSAQNHTVELMPQIQNLLNQKQIDIKTLRAIFVARGPGSFNGLRVGISTAKGLAFALAVPLVSVNTLEMEAYPFAYTGLPLCPIHNGGRGELAVALFRQTTIWRCLETEHLITIEELCKKMTKTTLFCGEIPSAVIPQLIELLGNKAVIPAELARRRTPGSLSALGWKQMKEGKLDDVESLQPVYMRQPPITQRKERIIRK